MSLECPYPHLVISPENIIQENEGRVDEWENSAIFYSFEADTTQFLPKQFKYQVTEDEFNNLPKQIKNEIKSFAAGRVMVNLRQLPNLNQLYLYEASLKSFSDILFLQNLKTLTFNSMSNLPDLRLISLLQNLKFVAFDNLPDTRFLPVFTSTLKISYNINIKNLVFQQRMTKCKGYNISPFIKEDLRDDWNELKKLKKQTPEFKKSTDELLEKTRNSLLFQVSGVHCNFFEKQLELTNVANFEETILCDDEYHPQYTIPLFFKYKLETYSFLSNIFTQNILCLNLANLKLPHFEFSNLINLRKLLVSRCQFTEISSIINCQELEIAQFSYCHKLEDLMVLECLKKLKILICRGNEKLKWIPNCQFLLVVGSELANKVQSGKLNLMCEMRIFREFEAFQQQNEVKQELEVDISGKLKCERVHEIFTKVKQNQALFTVIKDLKVLNIDQREQFAKFDFQ